MTREAYPSYVSDDEWAFVVPYLTLMKENAPQREHSLREVFNGLRYNVRTGMQWRMMPAQAELGKRSAALVHGVLADPALVCSRTWCATCACCCARSRAATHRAAIFDSRTMQSSPESGAKGRRCIWPSIPWASCWPPS